MHPVGISTVYFIFSGNHKLVNYILSLTVTALWADSADDKLMIIFLVFPRKQDLTFEMSNPVFWKKNKKNISKFHQKILPIVLLKLTDFQRLQFNCKVWKVFYLNSFRKQEYT